MLQTLSIIIVAQSSLSCVLMGEVVFRELFISIGFLFVYRCKTCGEYIYKGKKFNARKETVQNELYMGLPIFRFYIKCTRCLAEITFKVRIYNA